MKKVFGSKSTKVGVIGVGASALAEALQTLATTGEIPPELIAALADADLKYWVLAGVVMVLAKISPDKDDDQEKIGGSR